VRSVEEVRRRKLDELRSMLAQPDTWASDGRALQTLALGAIGELCFIDEREDELAERGRAVGPRYGKLGIRGAFDAVFDGECDYAAEVASVYAQLALQLGYLNPSQRLSSAEWLSLISGVRERYEEVDLRRSQLIEDLGEASVEVGRRVLCYVGPEDTDWVAFDCWEAPLTKYYVEGARGAHIRAGVFTTYPENPLLRDVRVPAPSFNESLILTTYGKVLRWGSAWWLRTQPARPDEAPAGVRTQLQAINAGDPSQALGPARPA